jgi:hypothetical protein
VNGVVFITGNGRGRADAVLVRRFRRARNNRERAAVFAAVVREHRDAVLGCCAERLWPDADAAVAAAGDVLIVAHLAMADPAKLTRPDRLRDWLLGIAAHDGLTSGLPARINDINWAAVQAYVAADVPDMQSSVARQASLRHWLDQIVATLPESRQLQYGLFVARGLDSRNVAWELGTDVAEVRRLRRENRQAILRAFEVTALAAEAGPDRLGNEAPWCGELRQICAAAQRDGGAYEGVRRDGVVLPTALRLAVARHAGQCGICRGRRDDLMAQWAPDLLPILAGAELTGQVMEDTRHLPESVRPRAGAPVRRPPAWPGAGNGAASVRTATAIAARRASMAAGAGLLAAFLLLGFVWPGFLHGATAFAPQDSSSPSLSSQDPGNGAVSGSGTPSATGTSSGVSGPGNGREVPRGTAGPSSSRPSEPAGSPAASSSSGSPTPPVQHTVQPGPSSKPAQVQPATGQPATSPGTTPPASPPPSPSTPEPTPDPSTPTPSSPVSPPPSTTPPPSAPASTTPAPPALAPSTPPAFTPAPATPSASAPAPSISASLPD